MGGLPLSRQKQRKNGLRVGRGDRKEVGGGKGVEEGGETAFWMVK